MNDLQRWLSANDEILDALDQANSSLTHAAGHAGDCATRSETSVETHAALSELGDKASAFLTVITRAQALPPIPDTATQEHFAAALATWQHAAQGLSSAAARRDQPAIYLNCDRLEAGQEQIYRMAAAMRRASGQPPDPNNPYTD